MDFDVLTEEEQKTVDEICLLAESSNQLLIERKLTMKALTDGDLKTLFSQMEAGKLSKTDFFEIAEKYTRYHSHLYYFAAAKRIPHSIAIINAHIDARKKAHGVTLHL